MILRLLSFTALTAVSTAQFIDTASSAGSYVFSDGASYKVNADDWSGVPAEHVARKIPDGCKCVESGTTTGCKFDCTCTCNLTPNQCDANCCCDTDCTAAEILLFKGSNSFCRDTTTTILSVSKCVSTDTVLEINPSYGLRDVSTEGNALDGFLCVTKDNNPTKGNFYTAITTPQDEKILDSSNVKRSYSFLKTRSTTDSYEQDGYVSGNRLQAAFPAADASKKGYAAFGGFMPLPTAGVDGKCSTQNPMLFQNVVTDNQCMRTTPLGDSTFMKTSCETMFGYGSFVGDGDDLYVAKKFSMSLAAGIVSDTDSYVPVTVGSVTYKNIATGAYLYNHVMSSYVNPSKDGNTFWDAHTQTCTNALVSIHYRVTYMPRTTVAGVDGKADTFTGGDIESVIANLVVGNLTTSGTGTSQYLSLQQEYLVDYIKSGVTRPRSRSGMPGYIDGRPVLAGNLVANGATGVDTPKEAIEQMVDGLRIPFYSNEQGDCIADIEKQFDEQNPRGELVNFRHELIKTCSLSVTQARLKAMCENDPSTVTKTDLDSTYGVYLNASGIPKKIGVYGNANYTNVDTSEWLDLKVNTPVGTGTFDGNKLVCQTLITSMNLEFLYANAGAYMNPQPKIVAARVSFGREDVKFIADSNPTTSTKEMILVLTTSVSFVHLVNEALEEYVPPAPPLLPEIPYDIFYPFLLSGAQRSVANVWMILTMTLASCVLTALR